MSNLLIADLLLVTHVAFVLFVVFGLLLIIAGKLMSWSWVRNPYFRLTHLICIAVVVVQSWLGIICPLTTWEMAFRARAGAVTYPGSFITHWLGELLYFQAPEWMFAVAYTTFGVLVLVSWFWARPRSLRGPGS